MSYILSVLYYFFIKLFQYSILLYLLLRIFLQETLSNLGTINGIEMYLFLVIFFGCIYSIIVTTVDINKLQIAHFYSNRKYILYAYNFIRIIIFTLLAGFVYFHRFDIFFMILLVIFIDSILNDILFIISKIHIILLKFQLYISYISLLFLGVLLGYFGHIYVKQSNYFLRASYIHIIYNKNTHSAQELATFLRANNYQNVYLSQSSSKYKASEHMVIAIDESNFIDYEELQDIIINKHGPVQTIPSDSYVDSNRIVIYVPDF